LHLDIPVHVLREAWRRRVDGKTSPLTARPVRESEQEPPPPSPRAPTPAPTATGAPAGPRPRKQTVTPKQRANLTKHVSNRKAAKEPVEGMRVCSAPCHEGERLTPKQEFSVKDKAKGTLRAWCKCCPPLSVQTAAPLSFLTLAT
jgi:hypothetical protein